MNTKQYSFVTNKSTGSLEVRKKVPKIINNKITYIEQKPVFSFSKIKKCCNKK